MQPKTWFITGVNSGFGRLMLEQLLERGDRVAGTARRLESLAGLAEQYRERFHLARLDVTDTANVHRVVDEAFEHFGRVDVIVNNAGSGVVGAAEEVTDEQIVHQFNVNTIGSIQVTRAALPHLRAQGGGRILQVSSMGAQVALAGLCLYTASKWAIEGFFESASADFAAFGIEATMVEPGVAKTSFFDSSANTLSPALAAYANTPAGASRRRFASGMVDGPGDPAKMVDAMIRCADEPKAPKRLVLGSDAYTRVRANLADRLAALDAQKAAAFATDK